MPDAPAFTPSPIRFRVWDGERMHTPGKGSPVSHIVTRGGRVHMAEESAWPGDLVAMLSTGLRDAAGVEVFEGDLIEPLEHPGTIRNVLRGAMGWEWSDTCWPEVTDWLGEPFKGVSPGDPGDYLDRAYERICWRVVGNVYEGVREPA